MVDASINILLVHSEYVLLSVPYINDLFENVVTFSWKLRKQKIETIRLCELQCL